MGGGTEAKGGSEVGLLSGEQGCWWVTCQGKSQKNAKSAAPSPRPAFLKAAASGDPSAPGLVALPPRYSLATAATMARWKPSGSGWSLVSPALTALTAQLSPAAQHEG